MGLVTGRGDRRLETGRRKPRSELSQATKTIVETMRTLEFISDLYLENDDEWCQQIGIHLRESAVSCIAILDFLPIALQLPFDHPDRALVRSSIDELTASSRRLATLQRNSARCEACWDLHHELGRNVYCDDCWTKHLLYIGARPYLAIDAARAQRYETDVETLQRLVNRAGGCCEICGSLLDDGFHVDHNHGSGEVRGALCRSCNHGLGVFKDDPIRLMNAWIYLFQRGFETDQELSREMRDLLRAAWT